MYIHWSEHINYALNLLTEIFLSYDKGLILNQIYAGICRYISNDTCLEDNNTVPQNLINVCIPNDKFPWYGWWYMSIFIPNDRSIRDTSVIFNICKLMMIHSRFLSLVVTSNDCFMYISSK